MIPLWIILTLTAAIFWALVSLLDKFVVSQELKDPILATVVSSVAATIVFLSSALIMGSKILIPSSLILITIFAGIFYTIAAYFYFVAVKSAEISRVISFLSITPIFVLILAFIFLGEKLAPINYFGIVLLVFGSFLISLKKNHHSEYKVQKAFFIVVIASLFLALRDVIIKFASSNVEIWSALFWLGIGCGLTSIFLFAKHHPHLKKKAVKGIEHLFLGRIFSSIALLFFLVAISMTSVSLVSALGKIQVLFVFLGTVILSIFKPSIIKEKINVFIIIQKAVAIIAILAGAFLLI